MLGARACAGSTMAFTSSRIALPKLQQIPHIFTIYHILPHTPICCVPISLPRAHAGHRRLSRSSGLIPKVSKTCPSCGGGCSANHDYRCEGQPERQPEPFAETQGVHFTRSRPQAPSLSRWRLHRGGPFQRCRLSQHEVFLQETHTSPGLHLRRGSSERRGTQTGPGKHQGQADAGRHLRTGPATPYRLPRYSRLSLRAILSQGPRC